MKNKTLLSLVIALVLSSSAAFARMGTESGGGGDPDAVDFLLKVRVVGEWAKSGAVSVGEDEGQKISSTARKLSLMMDEASQTPITMVQKNLTDASGASKVAMFNLNAFKIEITRSKWRNLSEEDKYVTAALELFGLAQITDRYGIAGQVKNDIQRVMQLRAGVEASMDLPGAEWIYDAMAAVFPEFNENIGGFSYEMSLKELLCVSSTSYNNGSAVFTTDCTATNWSGQSITRPAANLILVLVNARVPLDTHSEPGTTYINLQNVSCGVLEPRSSDPSHPVEPEYFCSINNP
jgi:hypothetical protein